MSSDAPVRLLTALFSWSGGVCFSYFVNSFLDGSPATQTMISGTVLLALGVVTLMLITGSAEGDGE